MKIVGGLLCFLSWILVIGIVGGVECETIMTTHALITLCAALSVGAIGCALMSEKRR